MAARHRRPDNRFDREHAVDATAWFSVLMHARQASQFDEAARAQQELKQLGVVVKFQASRLLRARASREQGQPSGGNHRMERKQQ